MVSIVCVRTILGLGVLLALVLGTPRAAPTEPPAPDPVAEINGEPITAEELQQALGTKLSPLREQIYQLERQGLEGLIAQRLLAQEATRRGISVAAVLDAEVTSRVEAVTEQEVDAFYQANKARLRGDEASQRENIRAHLQERNLLVRRARLLESLRAKANVVVRLQPPPIVRVAVSIEGAPVRGAAQAPVTLVEFSDFHCPFCKRAQATLKQILDRYPGKVRHVFRDFPVDGLHPQARQAAEAARCAHDQGKFWEYHDVLFTSPPGATSDDLRRFAEQTGLAVQVFEHCILTGTHRVTVQQDLDEGTRLGVTGTPTFFINGRLLTGAQPLEAFARIIEDELSRP
jgi:protein-disulfide isomerase